MSISSIVSLDITHRREVTAMQPHDHTHRALASARHTDLATARPGTTSGRAVPAPGHLRAAVLAARLMRTRDGRRTLQDAVRSLPARA